MRERLRARNAVRMALAAGISAAARSGRQRAHGGEGRARSTLVLRQATVGERHAGVRELPSAIARLQRGSRDSDRLDRPEASSQLHGARQRRVLGDVHLGAFRNQHDRAARAAAVVRRSAGGDGRRGHEQEILARIRDDATYRELFARAFPGIREQVTFDNVAKALSSFVRTLVSFDSPFDRYAYFGEDAALTQAQVRGMNLFMSERLECAHCHAGFNFSQFVTHESAAVVERAFHVTGLYPHSETYISGADYGLFAVTGASRRQGSVQGADVAQHRAQRAVHARWKSRDARRRHRLLRGRRPRADGWAATWRRQVASWEESFHQGLYTDRAGAAGSARFSSEPHGRAFPHRPRFAAPNAQK